MSGTFLRVGGKCYLVAALASLSAVIFEPLCAFSALSETVDVPDRETVVVVAATPLPGTNIEADKIPGELETLSVPELLLNRQPDVLPNAIATQLSSISVNDEQGSQFQPDLVYRGFEASPISGVAEGIAVYEDGVRLNEEFGDNVNWDLIPEFAIERFTLQSNNPVFGLNALGGAVTLDMKSGLDFHGVEAELSGGSFGNVTGNGEYGARFGRFAVYFGVGGVHDDGFRYRSPTALRQTYGDLAFEDRGLTLHLSLSGAINDIAAVGPTPVELLTADRRAVFTYPQSMRNAMGLLQFRGAYQASDAWSVSFNAYYRHFDQSLVDGNTTDVDTCANDPGQLCLEGNYDYPGDALYNSQGTPVPASALPVSATPGETDYTHTNTDTLGAAVQASSAAPIWEHANSFVMGASVDRGATRYSAYGELGTLLPSFDVIGSGVIIDQAASTTAQRPIEEPVSVEGRNLYGGFYALDAFDITPALSATASARLNIAEINLVDELGISLNSSHTFSHVNPGVGLTYRFYDGLTAYAGYSQSNRAPTAGELSCANPAAPCVLDAFLVSDPSLKQVVSHDYEIGLRGKFTTDFLPGAFQWNAGLYRTNADNDILLLATAINGFGYFRNSGLTRHQGVDAKLSYRDDRWTLSASYSYLDATFRNAEVLSSNSPSADAHGYIYVQPGDQIPMNPPHRATLSVDHAVTPRWSLGADLRAQSGQYLVGDESNQQPKIPGFATANLRTLYAITPNVSVFGEVQNLFDQHYCTYATFTKLDGLPPNFSLSNPRTYSPAPGRLFFGGIRVGFE